MNSAPLKKKEIENWTSHLNWQSSEKTTFPHFYPIFKSFFFRSENRNETCFLKHFLMLTRDMKLFLSKVVNLSMPPDCNPKETQNRVVGNTVNVKNKPFEMVLLTKKSLILNH